jgi:hypothetical protein
MSTRFDPDDPMDPADGRLGVIFFCQHHLMNGHQQPSKLQLKP